MRFKFWGVRGSIPTPLTPEKVRSKMASIVQRIRPEDIDSIDSRERFLAKLPLWLFGTTGGNTPCVEVRTRGNSCIIFDAGSGLRELGASLLKERNAPREFHIFFSHFHYDHLQGLPFFGPLYNPNIKVTFYSPVENLEQILRGHMQEPYFPVTVDMFNADITYVHLKDQCFEINDAAICHKLVNHPGNCFSYRVENDGKSFVYSTDTELTEADFDKSEINQLMYKNLDVLVIDTQYTLGEAVEKYNWGHSSFSLAVDFASVWEIKRMFMYHHEPMYDDKKLNSNLKSARWYLSHLNNTSLQIELAEEGYEEVLG